MEGEMVVKGKGEREEPLCVLCSSASLRLYFSLRLVI
jgi:hypothetical protein